MLPRLPLARTALCLTVTAGLLAGCGHDPESSSGHRVTSLGPTTATSTTSDATDEFGGHRATVRLAKVGLSFEAPAGWRVMSSATIERLSKHQDTDVYAEIAGQLGMSPEAFRQLLKSVDVYVVDVVSGLTGFATTINAISSTTPIPAAQLARKAIDTQARAFHGHLLAYAQGQDDIGPYAHSTFDGIIGGRHLYFEGLIQQVDGGGFTNITVASRDRSTAAAALQDVATTLRQTAGS